MKKFDKLLSSRYVKDNGKINFKTPAKSRVNRFHFYWKNKRIIKDGAYSGWYDLVNDILRTNGVTTHSCFEYSLRFIEKYNSFSNLLNYPMSHTNNFSCFVYVYYDSDIIEDILKPSRILFRWNHGFHHCINFDKDIGTFFLYEKEIFGNKLLDYIGKGDIFMEHGAFDQRNAFKSMLKTRFDDIPEDFKGRAEAETMDYESLLLTLEMCSI